MLAFTRAQYRMQRGLNAEIPLCRDSRTAEPRNSAFQGTGLFAFLLYCQYMYNYEDTTWYQNLYAFLVGFPYEWVRCRGGKTVRGYSCMQFKASHGLRLSRNGVRSQKGMNHNLSLRLRRTLPLVLQSAVAK